MFNFHYGKESSSHELSSTLPLSSALHPPPLLHSAATCTFLPTPSSRHPTPGTFQGVRKFNACVPGTHESCGHVHCTSQISPMSIGRAHTTLIILFPRGCSQHSPPSPSRPECIPLPVPLGLSALFVCRQLVSSIVGKFWSLTNAPPSNGFYLNTPAGAGRWFG